jgi:hypothetical protein
MSFSVALSKPSDVLMSTGVVTLDFFCLQIAASLLDSVNHRMREAGLSGAEQILKSSVKWGEHGYLYSLQSLAEFLYASIPALSQIHTTIMGERTLIKTALVSYQRLKTKIVEDEQKEFGSSFGRATQFTNMDWTDRNDMI